eukprot:SAG31_NODE_2430_length_5708_cov_2.891246_4_plen_389_part_00
MLFGLPTINSYLICSAFWSSNAWLPVAAAAIKVEKYAIALEACDEALAMVPDDPKALYRKGVCLWKRGRLGQAEKVLQKVLQLHDSNGDLVKSATSALSKVAKAKRADKARKKRIGAGIVSGKVVKSHADPVPSPAPASALPLEIPDVPISLDDARSLQRDFEHVYASSKIEKLCARCVQEAEGDMANYIAMLRDGLLPFQRATLARYGFEPTHMGVEIMKKAVGKHSASDVRKKSREISAKLMKPFYEGARTVQANQEASEKPAEPAEPSTKAVVSQPFDEAAASTVKAVGQLADSEENTSDENTNSTDEVVDAAPNCISEAVFRQLLTSLELSPLLDGMQSLNEEQIQRLMSASTDSDSMRATLKELGVRKMGHREKIVSALLARR